MSQFKRNVAIEAGYMCENPACDNQMVEAHHIDYKSKTNKKNRDPWYDSIENGMGLCGACHYIAHNGHKKNKQTGRQFVYKIIDCFKEGTRQELRWRKVKKILEKSLIMKGLL